jgi:hypothetical protein
MIVLRTLSESQRAKSRREGALLSGRMPHRGSTGRGDSAKAEADGKSSATPRNREARVFLTPSS